MMSMFQLNDTGKACEEDKKDTGLLHNLVRYNGMVRGPRVQM